jgi:hypothetical protein
LSVWARLIRSSMSPHSVRHSGLMAARVTDGEAEHRFAFVANPRRTIDRRRRRRGWDQHIAYRCFSVTGLPAAFAAAGHRDRAIPRCGTSGRRPFRPASDRNRSAGGAVTSTGKFLASPVR